MAKRVLIICTGNSCRSQIAEALWRNLGGSQWEAFSAGTEPAGYVHPFALDAMREAGLDTAGAHSKSIHEFDGKQFDLVVTVCDGAKGSCGSFAGATHRLHWPFPDPAASGDPEAFRQVRDRIRARIESYLASD